MTTMAADPLFHSFAITDFLPCMADPERMRAIVELSDDISPVFPYLNATVRNAIYNPATNSVTLKRASRLITAYPRGITMAKVQDVPDAEEHLRWFQELCNDTWQRREELTPNYSRRRVVDPLDVYELLPKLNCKACGQASCWTFSFELLFGDQTLAGCPPLATPSFAELGRQLADLLG
jgi:ArsR family metal-binding transcriptional regulator